MFFDGLIVVIVRRWKETMLSHVAALLLCIAVNVGVATASSPFRVLLTPWCDNSIRVRVQLASMPASTAAAQAALWKNLGEKNLTDLPGALDIRPEAVCNPASPVVVTNTTGSASQGNLHVEVTEDGAIRASRVDTGEVLFTANAQFTENPVTPSPPADGREGYLTSNLSVTASATTKNEILYGLGQGNWTEEGGCPDIDPKKGARIVPLERNGQAVDLMQRKFHVSIPVLFSTAGYVFLMNQPGYGLVNVGDYGVGGAEWSLTAALYIDFWISALPKGVSAPNFGVLYSQYADATGHAPPLRDDAMLFWQSRNRYKSSAIALSVAQRYQQLDLPVGVLVIDFKNQVNDGDFTPNPACFPSVKDLSSDVRTAINATTMFSFWPEVLTNAQEYDALLQKGCLINPDLGGLAIDATIPECRAFIWEEYLKPRYYDQGVSAYWLDETDGEGTGGGDGNFGYNNSYGPPAAYSNMWVNDWLRLFTEPVANMNVPNEPPLALTRGVWAGGQRNGIVLWSSDIRSTFEQLASQVPQGVHASMSGIPYWSK